MRKLGLLLIACFSFTFVSVTQNNIVKNLERDAPGQGEISIYQDAHIEVLVGSEYIPTGSEDQRVIKGSGHRVQMYADNSTRQAKNEVYPIVSDTKERFSNLPVYTSLNPPRWLCCAGDFRSIKEVGAITRQLRVAGVFGGVPIVKDQINIPL